MLVGLSSPESVCIRSSLNPRVIAVAENIVARKGKFDMKSRSRTIDSMKSITCDVEANEPRID